MAHLPYRALVGALSRREMRVADQINLAALVNRGAIRLEGHAGKRYVVTDDVRYALDF